MGTYINKGNTAFREYRNDIYVDKTGLIDVINKTLTTQRRYSCVTRCRRFGKSMAAKMLCAYYDKSCDSRALFADLAIAQKASFEKHLNKYPVIYLDVTSFTTRPELKGKLVKSIQKEISDEIKSVYPTVKYQEGEDLMGVLTSIHNETGERFVFIIDEWDAICREYPERKKLKTSPDNIEPTIMDEWVMLLRRLFKTQDSDEIFVGVYITGILPVKKYNTESALNNFREYSMIDPKTLAPYFGFTEKEVETLSEECDISMDEFKKWYDGYKIGKEKSIYNPYSVMEAIYSEECKDYWQITGAYNAVASYIQSNFDGLKDDIIKMLAGESVHVNTTSFTNDIHDVNSKDDVLTLLIHLGYLAFNQEDETCYIPNKEVEKEMQNAVRATNWKRLADVIENSQKLVDATLNRNVDFVADSIDRTHDQETSILSYNDENSLSCVLSIAYIAAKKDYIIHRELATGKGFADIVMIPRRNVDKPALVIELKYNQTVDTAISQIKNKNYSSIVSEYTGNILLVGINYDKETKKHTCKIESVSK